jgi:hypothetical protein
LIEPEIPARAAGKPSPILRGRKPSARIIACARKMKPFVRNRRSWGKPFWHVEIGCYFATAPGLPKKPRSTIRMVCIRIVGRGWRAQRATFDVACAAQAFANLARTEAVRADHRLRTKDEAIRAQSTIMR